MNYARVLELIRTGGTQRYHTIVGDLLKTQTVGQHCYGVFWFVHALLRGQPSANVLIAAMAHDAGERWAGDMPGPTKREIDMKPALDAYEAKKLLEWTGFEPPPLQEFEALALRMADSFDGLLFCATECDLGNNAGALERTYKNYLQYVGNILVANSVFRTPGATPPPQVDFELAGRLYTNFSDHLNGHFRFQSA